MDVFGVKSSAAGEGCRGGVGEGVVCDEGGKGGKSRKDLWWWCELLDEDRFECGESFLVNSLDREVKEDAERSLARRLELPASLESSKRSD